MARKRKKDLVKSIGMAIFLAVGIVSLLYANEDRLFGKQKAAVPGTDCYVDFIDCGQGDSTLIVSDSAVALIDATTGDDAERVVSHLRIRNIQKIDHFILTHPHEDHIGGAEDVLDEFDVENIYMKRPTPGTEPTTAVYLNLLKKIKEQGKTVTAVEPEDTFTCGAFDFTILGPLEEYKDLNDQSVVVRAEYGKVSFLFTGDQESSPEKDLVERYGSALESTLLKAGHHGSSTSSSKTFLQAVSPQYAVISCGKDNSYGHPHNETIERFEKADITYYRTDTQGTITFYTDGERLEYQEETK